MNKILTITVVLLLAIAGYILSKTSLFKIKKTHVVETEAPTDVEKREEPNPRKSGPDYSRIKIANVIKKDIKPGEGEVLKKQRKALLEYQVYVYDPARRANRGRLLYKSKKEGETFNFVKNRFFSGWQEALEGLREGGERTLVIPKELTKEIKKMEFPEGSIAQIEVKLIKIIK